MLEKLLHGKCHCIKIMCTHYLCFGDEKQDDPSSTGLLLWLLTAGLVLVHGDSCWYFDVLHFSQHFLHWLAELVDGFEGLASCGVLEQESSQLMCSHSAVWPLSDTFWAFLFSCVVCVLWLSVIPEMPGRFSKGVASSGDTLSATK
jgi:hypothetical protein